MDRVVPDLALILALFILGFIVGAATVYSEAKDNMHAEAIKHNCAYYSEDKGEFTWRELNAK